MIQMESKLKKIEMRRINNATKVIVSTLGVILGISGMCHGFFEVLQGNTPTNALIIHAIGTQNMMWAYGNEPAFTLIPNFLITGIAAIIVSLAVIVWSIGFVHKKNGPFIFLLLFILLFLVGGGLVFIILAFISRFAHDIEKQEILYYKTLNTKRFY